MIGPLAPLIALLWRAARRFSADHGANHAAAVAYFSLLSLPPFTTALLSATAPTLPARMMAAAKSAVARVRRR